MTRDMKRLERRGIDMGPLFQIISLLCQGGNVPPQCRPHKLHGEWVGCWECHVGNDWLLVYIATDTDVILYRTGSHADLFE